MDFDVTHARVTRMVYRRVRKEMVLLFIYMRSICVCFKTKTVSFCRYKCS